MNDNVGSCNERRGETVCLKESEETGTKGRGCVYD